MVPRKKRIHRRRDADPAEGVKKYGQTRFADPTNKKYPIDTPGRIKAAWAYIHQPSNARKYSAAERRTIIGRYQTGGQAAADGTSRPRGIPGVDGAGALPEKFRLSQEAVSSSANRTASTEVWIGPSRNTVKVRGRVGLLPLENQA